MVAVDNIIRVMNRDENKNLYQILYDVGSVRREKTVKDSIHEVRHFLILDRSNNQVATVQVVSW